MCCQRGTSLEPVVLRMTAQTLFAGTMTLSGAPILFTAAVTFPATAGSVDRDQRKPERTKQRADRRGMPVIAHLFEEMERRHDRKTPRVCQ